ETGRESASQNKGLLHACGHDVHSACLLGAAKILKRMEGDFEGRVKLIFQPSEEDYKGGAPVMLEQGVLRDPEPQAIYALHILPELECGKIGYRSGKYMASTDEVYLKVKGKAGHGAAPERNIDPVVASAYIITALQQIVSRQASPFTPTVLSFGRIIGEGQTNVIPAEVKIDGTFRTFDETWRKKAHGAITRCAEETAKACGAECEVRIAQGYPSVCNDPKITQKLKETAEKFVGGACVEELPLRMTADDFAFYTQQVPGCMFRLGVKPEGVDEPANLHTGRLRVDEACLKTGAGLLALLAMA
ncbi:MAG: amidohydrolase, partial [Bacteroidales bacterium]|nr:amidohydrolase [Bacteroidales bacterium]